MMNKNTSFYMTIPSTESSSNKHQDSFNGTINPRRESSIAIVRLVTFVGDAARGILFPALWPLCHLLGGSRITLGYLVATFSIGRLLVTTRLGIMADTYGHRRALILSGIVLTVGCLLWANAPFLGGLVMLYLAQLTLGLGTGSLGVTRSYIAEQTDPPHRTHRLASLSALQYAGFAATPLLGSGNIMFSFAQNGGENDTETTPTNDMENQTSPLSLQQQERSFSYRSEATGRSTSSVDETSVMLTDNSQSREKSFDAHARGYVYYLMMFLNFSTRGAIAVFETQASHMLLDQYHLSQIWLGSLVSVAGSIGTLQLIFFQRIWSGNFSDFTLMVAGLALLGLAQLLAISWDISREDSESPKSPWRFVVALYLVYALAYPVGNSAVLGIFSVLQKTGKQAKAQSLFAFMGSLARVICPIISGYMEQYVETGAAFGFVLILVTVSIFSVMMLRAEILYCYYATSQDRNDRLQFIRQSTILHGHFSSGQFVAVVMSMVSIMLVFATILNWSLTQFGWS
eukprot:scaffold3051_cov167-Ochromonas_danica.AAC.37